MALVQVKVKKLKMSPREDLECSHEDDKEDKHHDDENKTEGLHPDANHKYSTMLPEWVNESVVSSWGEPLSGVLEWEETNPENHEEYRRANGWFGNDFCHDKVTSPVYVTHYRAYFPHNHNTIQNKKDKKKNMSLDGVGTRLRGVAHFTRRAESHKGHCHGGSMCALMDDVIGWCGFLTTGKCIPWCGYTAQINTSLKKPIRVESFLQITATIVKRERRKVYIEAVLEDPGNDGCVHATGTGLFLLKRDVNESK